MYVYICICIKKNRTASVFMLKKIRNLKKTFCYGVELLFLFDLSPNRTM